MQCYLCGSKKYFRREGKVRDNPAIDILECESCGLVFLSEQHTSDVFYTQGGMHNQQKVYVDFGSGYGGFLIQAKPFAKSVLGIELESQVKPVYESHGIPLASSLEEVLSKTSYGGGGEI